MRIHDHDITPNARRVRIFVAEKGDLPIEFVLVNIMTGAHKSPDYLAKNCFGVVPTLELDDGTCIGETIAICRYLESVYPEPNMFGRTPLEQAQIESWQRRTELYGFNAAGAVFRHSSPFFAHEPQIADWAERNRGVYASSCHVYDANLADRPYIAGERFSVADITLLCTVDFAGMAGLEIPDGAKNLRGWYDRVASRPSATANPVPKL